MKVIIQRFKRNVTNFENKQLKMKAMNIITQLYESVIDHKVCDSNPPTPL